MQIIVTQLPPMTARRVLAPIHAPLDVGLFAQHIGLYKGADVEPHAVVEVGIPAEGLLFERFPAHEDVVGRFAFQDQFEFFFQVQGGGAQALRAAFSGFHLGLALADPVAEVGVDEFLQVLFVEQVVVDQGAEAVFAAIPDMPEEGPVVE